MSKFKVLFGLTGSIACYKSCSIISRLVQNDVDVKVACSPSAWQFIGASTLEGLSHRKVYSDIFESSDSIEHVDLVDWYNLAIVCPATGNTINKLAAGIADEPISCQFLAHDFAKPYIVAPAMNVRMFKHPQTQESLEKLRSWGVRVLDTDTGYQACGTEGEGRLLDPDVIYSIIMEELERCQ